MMGESALAQGSNENVPSHAPAPLLAGPAAISSEVVRLRPGEEWDSFGHAAVSHGSEGSLPGRVAKVLYCRGEKALPLGGEEAWPMEGERALPLEGERALPLRGKRVLSLGVEKALSWGGENALSLQGGKALPNRGENALLTGDDAFLLQ